MSIEEEEEEEEDGQIVSLGDSRIERIRGHLAILSMLKVRVEGYTPSLNKVLLPQ